MFVINYYKKCGTNIHKERDKYLSLINIKKKM